MPKLRIFVMVNPEYGTENYVVYNLSKRQISLCAQVRSGVLTLTVETGRYVNLQEEKRIGPMCFLNDIENELHFVFYCPFYCEQRDFFVL